MKLYFSDSQIPELKGFTKRSQSFLKQAAMQRLEKCNGRLIPGLPTLAGIMGLGAGWMVSLVAITLLWPSFPATWVEHRMFRDLLAGAPGAILIGGFMGFMGKQLLIARLRPHLRDLVEAEPTTGPSAGGP